jgi:hypothetical protein
MLEFVVDKVPWRWFSLNASLLPVNSDSIAFSTRINYLLVDADSGITLPT